MKITEPIEDRFLVWWMRSGRTAWSRFHRRFFERKYLKVVLPQANSLEDVRSGLARLVWKRDGPLHLFDCISYPQTTWAEKKDDCDGFASLAAALLKQWKPDTTPVLLTAGLRPIAESHTVCAFTSDAGDLRFFDNALLRPEACHSYAEIVSLIMARGRRLVCWDTKDPSTLRTLEFHLG